MKTVERCINIDWLEVYALEDLNRYPCDANFFREQGFQVLERDYGTRVYKEMFTLLDWHDEPLLEVRRAPASTIGKDGGLFPPNSCHLRLSNRTCYAEKPINILRDFMIRYHYDMVKIFRIDICLDFEKFDRGDDPQKFVARYMSGKYSKINQANISAHGVDRWDGRLWNSLSWGMQKSMVSTKLYCKTLELMQNKEKPYINMAWFNAHLIDDPINLTKRKADGKIYKPMIWRVEFSIKSSAKKIFVINKATRKKGKIVMPNTLDVYDTQMKLEMMFASLANHYFRFKKYENGVRKDRCEDKVTFDFSAYDTYYKIDRLASHTSKTKPAIRLINLLHNYATLHPNEDVKKAVKFLTEFINEDMLKEMNENGTLSSEIKALRILISKRLDGFKDENPLKQLDEIKRIIENEPSLF